MAQLGKTLEIFKKISFITKNSLPIWRESTGVLLCTKSKLMQVSVGSLQRLEAGPRTRVGRLATKSSQCLFEYSHSYLERFSAVAVPLARATP